MKPNFFQVATLKKNMGKNYPKNNLRKHPKKISGDTFQITFQVAD